MVYLAFQVTRKFNYILQSGQIFKCKLFVNLKCCTLSSVLFMYFHKPSNYEVYIKNMKKSNADNSYK